jgi:hypothetical protein
MNALAPLLRGSLQGHPLAERFAAEVLRVHRRYAQEVVAQNQLCPFLRDVDTGFGRFCVMLDPEPDVATAVAAVLAAGTSVIHLVYPCTVNPPASPFEKFAGKLSQALKKELPEAPVMATFHPTLAGDGSNPFRLVGLLRRAPDPFVQLIPEGLHQGGTKFAGAADIEANAHRELDPAHANFAKLRGAPLEKLVELMDEIRADRDRSYAPFLEALGAAQSA